MFYKEDSKENPAVNKVCDFKCARNVWFTQTQICEHLKILLLLRETIIII